MTSKKFSAKRPLTDDEEAEIQRMIASDPDNPELTDEQIAGLSPTCATRRSFLRFCGRRRESDQLVRRLAGPI